MCRSAGSFVFVLTIALSACGASDNVGGEIAATGTGDVIEPTAPRGDALAPFREACGEPELLIPFPRAPYVQLVDSDSARVMWTAASRAPVTVRVTRPGGAVVAHVPAAIEDTAFLSATFQHAADVTELEPATAYCYELVDGAGAALTTRIGFRTAPSVDAPFAFVALGDLGLASDDQWAVRQQMARVPHDLTIVTGDVAYSSGELSELQRHFFDVYDELIASIPVFPTSGNHDYETADAAPFREVFALPDTGGPAAKERWYSFDWGDVHFVALDTERLVPEQTVWLEHDLATNELPWVVVYLHRPPFSSGEHGSDHRAREELAPIFERFGVQLVLAGHDHHYERTVPLNGVTYFVTGGGGRGVRPTATSSFTAYSEAVIHFLLVEVEPHELRVHAIDGTGREFDAVRVLRAG
jgi:3',5'-cyclic AMP phosphodiesterase CpdA